MTIIMGWLIDWSGAVEQVDKALRDLGEHCALAKDGSTSISSMLAATTLGVLGSRARNVQQTRASFPDSKTSAQSVQNNVTNVDRRWGEEQATYEEPQRNLRNIVYTYRDWRVALSPPIQPLK